MFLPGLIGLGSTSKKVRLDSVGSYITTPPSGVNNITIDGIVDNLPSRPNSLLLLWVGTDSEANRWETNQVSRNGQNLTVGQALIGINESWFSLYYSLNPSASDGAGITLNTARDNFTANSRLCLAWAYLYGVNQTTPLEARVTATSTAANPVLTANPLSGAIGKYPITAVFGSDTDGSVNWTSNAGQTRLHTSVTNNRAGAAIDTTTPGSTTNFTITGQISNGISASMISMNVNPA